MKHDNDLHVIFFVISKVIMSSRDFCVHGILAEVCLTESAWFGLPAQLKCNDAFKKHVRCMGVK